METRLKFSLKTGKSDIPSFFPREKYNVWREYVTKKTKISDSRHLRALWKCENSCGSYQQEGGADELPAQSPVKTGLEPHHALNVLTEAVHTCSQRDTQRMKDWELQHREAAL